MIHERNIPLNQHLTRLNQRRRIFSIMLYQTRATAFLLLIIQTNAWMAADTSLATQSAARLRKDSFAGLLREAKGVDREPSKMANPFSAILAGALIAGSIATQPLPVEAAQYTSEPVRRALESLQSSQGNSQETLQTYEQIAAMITEGRGLGGDVNYKGVQLDRGYVADEDTSIYNPGLALLTESEKNRLVEALVTSRKNNAEQNAWNVDEQAGFDFLRGNLDPYHMYELKGYLSVVPWYAAAIYLAVFAVQQVFRPAFVAAYFVGVAAIALPIIALVAFGPQ